MASILQEGLEGYASGRFQSQAEVARFWASFPEFPKTANGKERVQGLQKQLKGLEKDVSAFLERIIGTTNAQVISAYESKIDALENEKLVLKEKLAKGPAKYRPFEEMFELTLKFLSNPCNIWKNSRPEHR